MSLPTFVGGGGRGGEKERQSPGGGTSVVTYLQKEEIVFILLPSLRSGRWKGPTSSSLQNPEGLNCYVDDYFIYIYILCLYYLYIYKVIVTTAAL